MFIVIKEGFDITTNTLTGSHVSDIMYGCNVSRASSYGKIVVHAQIVSMDEAQLNRFMNAIEQFMDPESISLRRVAAGYYELDIQVA